MTKKALLVGINYLKDPTVRLQGCIDDIANMAKTLTENYDYTKENIVQLRDDVSDANSQPTRANILRELTKLVEQSASLSEIWFHYSGHGSQIRDTNREEMDGLDEVLVPSDFKIAGFIADDEILNIVKNSKCKTVMLFDSCHSGTVCDLQWSFEYNFNGGFVKTQNNLNKIDNPYVFSISGCKDSQTSADSYSTDQKQPMGAFTDAFIHCLRTNNYNVNIIKLYADVCNYIRSEGYSQTPVLSCSSMIPSYIFIKTVLPLPSVLASTPVVPPTSATITASSVKPSSPNENITFTFGSASRNKSQPNVLKLQTTNQPPVKVANTAPATAPQNMMFSQTKTKPPKSAFGNMLNRLSS